MNRCILKQKLMELFDPIVVMKTIINQSVMYDIRNYSGNTNNCQSIIFHPVYIWMYEDFFMFQLYLKHKTFNKCKQLIDDLVKDQDSSNYKIALSWRENQMKIDFYSIEYNESDVNKLFELLNKVIALEA